MPPRLDPFSTTVEMIAVQLSPQLDQLTEGVFGILSGGVSSLSSRVPGSPYIPTYQRPTINSGLSQRDVLKSCSVL